jgi:hypothetical protein
MPRAARIVGAVLMALVVLAIAGLLTVLLSHPRDADGYLSYLKKYGEHRSVGPVAQLPPGDQLLAEGDAACAWLGEQPRALWHAEGNSIGEYVTRYLDDTSGSVRASGSGVSRRGIVAIAAWNYLCEGWWQVVGPVHVFQRANGD